MKKRTILSLVGLTVVAVGATAVVYHVVKTNQAMKPYPKKYKFKSDHIKLEDEFHFQSYAAYLAGLHFDFSEATLKDGKGYLSLYGYVSGINIQVPEHWVVLANGRNNASGINNRCDQRTDSNQPILTIDYDLNYSGLNIQFAKKKD